MVRNVKKHGDFGERGAGGRGGIPWRENIGLKNVLLERGEGVCELRQALAGLLERLNV